MVHHLYINIIMSVQAKIWRNQTDAVKMILLRAMMDLFVPMMNTTVALMVMKKKELESHCGRRIWLTCVKFWVCVFSEEK